MRVVPSVSGDDKMKINDTSRQGSDFWIGALVSFAVHLVVIVFLVLGFQINDEEEAEEDEESMEVVLEDEALFDDSEPDSLFDDLREAPVEEEAPIDEEALAVDSPPDEMEEQIEEAEEEDEQKDEQEFPDDTTLDRYAVDQETDDEEPDEADHLSDEAHRTEEETIAEVTTLDEVEPPEDPEAEEQEADTELEMAMQIPDEEIEEPDIVDPDDFSEEEIEEEFDEEIEEEEFEDEVLDDEEEPETEEQDSAEEREEIAEAVPESEYRDPQEMFMDPDRDQETPEFDEQVDRESLFGRDSSRADQVFDEQSTQEARERTRQGRQGRQLLSNWRENEEAMRAALENYLPHVQPGNHTSVNARASAHATYIARIHRSIHPKWAGSFIPRMSRNFSRRDPINDPNLVTVIELVIDADSGEVVETGPVRPSGHEIFDAEATTIARAVGDQPNPPDSIVRPDGNVYIHWTFWRDQRRCGTFGARILRLEDGSDRRPVGQ